MVWFIYNLNREDNMYKLTMLLFRGQWVVMGKNNIVKILLAKAAL